VTAIAGRFLCSWISDAWGRRPAGVFSCLTAAVCMSLAGYLHSAFVFGVSMFYVMLLLQSFFGSGNYSIVGPYMGELWPGRLRGSGMGFVYGIGNLGKFIGPAGLALIAGSSNYVKPEATLDALVPGFNYFAFWYVLGPSPSGSSALKRAAARSARSTARWAGRQGSRKQVGRCARPATDREAAGRAVG
jgi:putative MFS transporter